MRAAVLFGALCALCGFFAVLAITAGPVVEDACVARSLGPAPGAPLIGTRRLEWRHRG